MIDAKSLRLGNYLSSGKGIYKVAMICKPDEILCESEDGLLVKVPAIYNPIPLTLEWFQKLGFEYDTLWGGYKIEPDLFISENDSDNPPKGKEWIIWVLIDVGHTHIVTSSGYVHQFQNQIQALTGQELTIKEKVG